MVSVKYFLVIVFISLEVLNITGEEGVVYHLKGNRCKDFNPKFVSKLTCRVRAFNRTTKLMTYEGALQPNVTITNLRVEVISYRKFGLVYRPSGVKLSENWCDAMNGASTNVIFLLLKSYKKYGNIIQPCPLAGSFYVRNMIIDFSKFPKFIPIGDYRMEYSGHTFINGKKELVARIQDYWNIKPLGIEEF